MDERRADGADTADTVDSAPAARPVAALTARAAAEALGVSERTVRRAILRGDLPAAKSAGTYRVAPAALASFRRRLTAPTRLRRPARETPASVAGSVPRVLPPPSSSLPSLPAPPTPLVGRGAAAAAMRRSAWRRAAIPMPRAGHTRLGFWVWPSGRASS